VKELVWIDKQQQQTKKQIHTRAHTDTHRTTNKTAVKEELVWISDQSKAFSTSLAMLIIYLTVDKEVLQVVTHVNGLFT
jgi:hypothetical protein